MADMIPNYNCGYRQAVILKNENCSTGKALYERLLIGRDQAVFESDKSAFSIEGQISETFERFSDGDVVEISDRGVINLTFRAVDSDATIFMTGACNSNCIMCPASDVERRKEYGDRRSVINEYISMLPDDLRNYVVTGGEPTMNPDLFLDTMKLMAARFPKAEGLLLTNGRSFSIQPFLKKMLEYCPPYLIVAVPIHGASASLHDAITRSKGSFDQTMRGIRHLLDNKIFVEIRIVVTEINRKNISDICRLIVSDFPETYRVNFIGLEVRGNCYLYREQVYLEPKESFEASRDGIRILVEHGIDVGLYNYPLCCVDTGYQFLCKKSISPEKVRYDVACKSCKIREYCGGMFVSTLKTMKPRLYPYR